MTITEQQLLDWLASFIWPFFRIGSMFVSVPVISGRRVPARIRTILAALITFIILPVLPPMPDIELFSYRGFLVAIEQIFLGLATGFILQMVFSVLLLAGQAIAYSMGLGFASLVDPATGVQVPVVAQIFIVSGSLIFLAVNGHLIVIEMLVQSFVSLPVSDIGMDSADLWKIIAWSRHIFVAGVSLALPILTTLLFVNISFGVASRAAPQLQIFGIGFPITIMLGMVFIWIMMPEMLEGFQAVLAQGFALIRDVLRLA